MTQHRFHSTLQRLAELGHYRIEFTPTLDGAFMHCHHCWCSQQKQPESPQTYRAISLLAIVEIKSPTQW